MLFPIDRYTFRARVLPGLIVIAPLATAVETWLPFNLDLRLSSAALLLVAGGFLIAQLTRDVGKRLEIALWKKWGGMPSCILLRHHDRTIGAAEKKRLHAKLNVIIKGLNLPTAAEEELDPAKADELYTAACTWLRAQTRDTKKFNLLFEENVAYGFRRNLLAIKPYGLVTAAIGAASGIAAIWVGRGTVVGIIVSLVVFLYLLMITENSLRTQAVEYARRLLEAPDQLAPLL
jgi:hypothetical protein